MCIYRSLVDKVSFVLFQALKDTGLHHMNLLLILSRLSALCFLPVWLLLDVTRMVYDENVVSDCMLAFRFSVISH